MSFLSCIRAAKASQAELEQLRRKGYVAPLLKRLQRNGGSNLVDIDKDRVIWVWLTFMPIMTT